MGYSLTLPVSYHASLGPRETEEAILLIKNFFQTRLSEMLNLYRVTAPLFVKAGTGINDDLNGVERPVSFEIGNMGNVRAEIVQSLAKWKRLTLADLEIPPGEGIYTDMNAIRPDDTLSNIHSLYVDQWDWEKVISTEDRTVDFLKSVVEAIYIAIRQTEAYIFAHYHQIPPTLPEKIKFLHSEELQSLYPDLTPRERENRAAKEYGAIFVIGIGAALADGEPHDGRAPDYDDWTTPNPIGKGLNGDIIVWYPLLNRAVELSSMGIRVDKKALETQLAIRDLESRKALYFHQRLLEGTLPLSVGGGIGQSRLCLFLLRKAHIGEVQSSIWPDTMIKDCHKSGIFLL